MPELDIDALNEHLRQWHPGADAGWRPPRSSPRLHCRRRFVGTRAAPCSPELNRMKQRRGVPAPDWLSGSLNESYEAILGACRHAWNQPMRSPERWLRSTTCTWANRSSNRLWLV